MIRTQMAKNKKNNYDYLTSFGIALLFIIIIGIADGINIVGLSWPKFEGIVSSITQEKYPVNTESNGTIEGTNTIVSGTYIFSNQIITFKFISSRKITLSTNQRIIFHKSKSGILVYDPPFWPRVIICFLLSFVMTFVGLSQLIKKIKRK